VTQQQNLSLAKLEHPRALWGLAIPFLMSCAFGSLLSLCGQGPDLVPDSSPKMPVCVAVGAWPPQAVFTAVVTAACI